MIKAIDITQHRNLNFIMRGVKHRKEKGKFVKTSMKTAKKYLHGIKYLSHKDNQCRRSTHRKFKDFES